MVGIIVDDDGAIDFADLGEAALDPLETFKPGNYCLIGNTKLKHDGDCRECILDIVAAGDRDMDVDRAPLTVPVQDQRIELASARNRRDIVGADVGERRKSVTYDSSITNAADDVLHLGMVDAQHSEAVEGDVLDELD